MSAVATAIVGGSVISGWLGAEAAEDASEASSEASAASLAEQRRQFDRIRGDQAPYRRAGANALSLLEGNLREGEYDPQSFEYSSERPEFTGENAFNFNLQEDPGYQFARDEGIKYANREAAQGGKFNSGNRLAEIADRVTGIASQYADQAFNRQITGSRENYGRATDMYGRDTAREATDYNRALTDYGFDYQRDQDVYGQSQNYLNRLSSLAGIGQTANQTSAAAGSNMANAVGNIQMANAANQTAAANTRYGAYNDALQGGLNNYFTYQGMQAPGGGFDPRLDTGYGSNY